MSDYVPGSAYSQGYQSRMKGQPKTNGLNGNEVYNTEWLAGWEDAHKKIIDEARSNVGIEKFPGSFIQD